MDCVTCLKSNRCLVSDQRRRFRLPERLVGIGLRCWLAGFDTRDIECWEAGWRIYADKLGDRAAKGVVVELACWARALDAGSRRRIDYYPFYHPFDCVEFSHDECLAICMVAAGQVGEKPVLAECAHVLTGAADNGAVETAAHDFAGALDGAGIHLDRRILAESGIASAANAGATPQQP